MKIIADFHTHSRFAMACSANINLHGLVQASETKGITLVGTGDFTHPDWLSEIKKDLEEDNGTGLFKLKGSSSKVRFILSSEVSTVFNHNGATKKVHNLLLMPSIESVQALNDRLAKYGSLPSDGRPTLSISAAQLVETVFEVEKNAFVFPAHAWTPYFGVFGSLSGFNSMKEAYEDQEKHIYALETGLSSDSPMNWRISALDKYTLLSNSDMHSLEKLGRSANVFEMDEEKLSYDSITNAIKKKDGSVIKKIIQFYPEEGKYHFDGHKDCKFSVNPETSSITKCPVCGKKLLNGVLHRVNNLADRPVGFVPPNPIPFAKIVPLKEVIADVTRKGTYSVAVDRIYKELTSTKTEYDVLLNEDIGSIAKRSTKDIAEAISNMRSGNITIKPGYAGIFGEIDLLNRSKGKEKMEERRQRTL